MIWIIIAVIVLAIFYLKKRNRKITNLSHILEKDVSQIYTCEEGKFDIKGKKNNFIIAKNATIEFLVKDGQIVASRDLRVGSEFVYYGGNDNGIS